MAFEGTSTYGDQFTLREAPAVGREARGSGTRGPPQTHLSGAPFVGVTTAAADYRNRGTMGPLVRRAVVQVRGRHARWSRHLRPHLLGSPLRLQGATSWSGEPAPFEG